MRGWTLALARFAIKEMFRNDISKIYLVAVTEQHTSWERANGLSRCVAQNSQIPMVARISTNLLPEALSQSLS